MKTDSMKRLLPIKHLLRKAVLLFCILVTLASGEVIAQGRQITGQITDVKTKAGIPGVSIFEKGSLKGTVSDVNGNYALKVADDAILVFSSIGYSSVEINAGSRQVLDVSLTEDIKTLDEIVVVGYGEQKRSNLSGAIASVNMEDITNKAQMRVDNALQGMVAGVIVTRQGGAPGASPTIHIRGAGSIGDTQPLWIVDGVQMSPDNHFDADDIASIEILKDASAAAIYGARAANGVILVTTKRGKGDLQINFKSSIGKRSPVKLPTLLNSADFVKYRKEGRLAAGQNPEPSWDNYSNDTDWIKAFYNGSGIIQSYDLSVAKGDEKANFFMSFGNDNEQGILIDNSYKRYSMRINSDVNIAKWLKLGESLLLSKVKENPIGNNNENASGGVPYRSIPIMPIYDPSNAYGGWGTAPVYFQGPNPVATQYQQHETRTYNRIDGNVYLEAKPLTGLRIRATVGYNTVDFLGEKFDEAFNYGAFANPLGALTYSSANDEIITANIVTTYERDYGKHNFKLMGGYESYQFVTKHFNNSRSNFPIDVASSFNLGTGAFSTTDRNNVDQDRLLSQFGRFNYNYGDRYLAEVNFRRDASASKFGQSNLWGNFPSYSVGWRISEERFFENVPVVNTLKLRASSGKLGNENIRRWVFLKTYTSQFSTYAFDAPGTNKVSGFYISKFPNADVQWEEVNMSNVALDVTAFKNKLSVSVDYYIKDTKQLLFDVPVPSSVGISTNNFNPSNPPINIGTMRNRGIDIDASYSTKITNYSFTVGGNVSFLNNELTYLAGGAIIGGNGGGQIGGMTRTEAGHPISSFYGYQVQQMLNTEADVYAINTWAPDGLYQEAGTAPGDFMYRDISGPGGVPDGQVTPEYDRTFIGNPWPKMTYALNFSGSYKSMIDVSLQFQGIHGVDVFNASKGYTRNFFGDNNTTTDIFDAWTPENHTGNPRNNAGDPNHNFGNPSTYFVEDGSYLKLRNVQVGFTVPRAFLERVKIQRLRVYINANNLLTFTKYSGLDPEIAGSNTSRGVDFGNYPQVRTISAGLEVQF